MAATWPEEVDQVIAGDMTAALAYVTPAGGAVVTAVAPIGLRDRERGTIGFTTSLGFGKKLERIRRNPRVTLAYHARKHGFADGTRYVMVQGDAELTLEPDRDLLENDIGPRAERWLGPRKSGPFWDRWLQEYYADRVPVDVDVRRIVSWPQLDCTGEADVHGEAPRPAHAPPQEPPKKGVEPRIDSAKAARAAGKLPYVLLAFTGADGYPVVHPVTIAGGGADGIAIEASLPSLLPPGGRRAGLLAHDYGAQLLGLKARQFTGWLTAEEGSTRALYAPHTTSAFRAPGNKTMLLLANGFLAKRGLKKARESGALERLREPAT
ncbi:MAG TPA: pyridoxamine 5'-phosphate oxidase family protein [Thermoleophilaceae bacterium]|nr:pyridoxamine 5'-phosphate oxidase family protein [Thermoleophilaceae bacterium]